MTFLKFGVAALLVAIAAGAFCLEKQSNTQLREEVALLRNEVQQLGRQRADAAKAATAGPVTPNASVSDNRAEIAQLREELETLKARAKEFGQTTKTLQAAVAAGAAAKSVDSLPVKLTPLTDWKNAGRASVNSTIETVLWAASGGEVDLLAGTLEFTPSAHEKAQALFDRLPEGSRQQYGSPEKLMALMIAKDADKVSGMQILGQREISPDNVGVRLRFGNDLGQTKEQSMLLHHANDGWKLMLTDDPVEKFAKQLAGGGK
jgi:hypothetical protein